MTVLGIDGGGSKTKFLLEDDNGLEIARLETGPSNWLSAGAAAARESILEGLSQLPEPPDVVCGGFAGAGRPESAAFYRDCLQQALPRARVLVETDAFIAYIGAIGIRPGVLLIAGTGSIAVGRREDGFMVRAGGWGPYFGDEGSGHWIGREAVRTALRAYDAGEFPEFVSAVERGLGLRSITDAPLAWRKGNADVRLVASLAESIFQQYPAEPANRILNEAAAHLRTLVETAVRKVGAPACPLSVAGSVAAHPIMQKLLGLSASPPQHPPERGAIIWARSTL